MSKKCVCMLAAAAALSLMAQGIRVQAADPVAPTCQKASAPSPKDGATDARRDGTTLSWTPGGTTGKYDVYVGSVRKYVENAERAHPVYLEASSVGQTAKTFSPGRLELGKTYYWRVDEVNDVDPNNVTVCQGDIWSFMVEVPALPVSDVTATACGSAGAAQGPEKTVNGAGLSTAGLHTAEPNDMWLYIVPVVEPVEPNVPAEPNAPVEPNAPAAVSVAAEPNAPAEPNVPVVAEPSTWIQFQFAKVQKLYDMSIWNWNAKDSLDRCVKDITLEVSVNGTDWVTLGDVTLAQGTGAKDYACNNVIDMGGVAAAYVKLTVNSTYGDGGACGLSEVKFTAIPVYARQASPASNAKNIAVDATLSWRAGLQAGSHKVYIGTDKAAVEDGTAKSYTVNTNSFKLTSLDVQLEKTYYWRVDEVNEAADPQSFAGDVWNFTAVDYLVVEDFEKYKDDLAKTWTTTAGSTRAAIEKGIVYRGKQSLAVNYDTYWVLNIAATGAVSAPKNWTKNGIKKLVIFIHGDAQNPGGLLRLSVNNSLAASLATPTNPWWTYWVVDLASVKSTLGTVNSIKFDYDQSFGVRYRGAGKFYVDEIRVYNSKVPSLPDIVTKVVALNGSGATKGKLDTLIAAVSAADPSLLDLLSSSTTYTLFAPSDDAFTAAKVNEKTNKAILSDILRNHVVAKNVSATNKGKLTTLEGSTVVQDANVVTDDLGGKAVIGSSEAVLNGTIHTVDAVLMPFDLAKIMDILKSMNADGEYAGRFDTLLAGIAAAKSAVRTTLDKRHNTLFAPTDEAFAALGYDADTIKTLDQSLLTDILSYHIASGRLMSKDLGASITTTLKDGVLKYNKGKLTDAVGGKATLIGLDIEGSNGVIQIIDAVAMPFAKTRLLDVVTAISALNSAGSLAGKLDTLIAAAEAADPAVLAAVAGKGPYTIFAPTDAAFAAIGWDPNTVATLDRVYLGDVLLYHAVAAKLTAEDALAAQEIKTVQGGVITPDPNGLLVGAFAGKAKITTKNLEAFNGLVQVIDAVLLPYAAPLPPAPPEPQPLSILDTVATLNAAGDYAGQFDTFLAAVAKADKAVFNALTGSAENTLFIPTDDAFAALNPALDSLNKAVVTDILLYHLAAGKLLAADVAAAQSISMLKGGSLQQAEGVLTDNVGTKAKITGQDIAASNGVVHVIDAVLLPAKL